MCWGLAGWGVLGTPEHCSCCCLAASLGGDVVGLTLGRGQEIFVLDLKISLIYLL